MGKLSVGTGRGSTTTSALQLGFLVSPALLQIQHLSPFWQSCFSSLPSGPAETGRTRPVCLIASTYYARGGGRCSFCVLMFAVPIQLVRVMNKRPLSDEESALMGDALASRGEIRRQEWRAVATRSGCCGCHRNAHSAAGMQMNRGDGWMEGSIRSLVLHFIYILCIYSIYKE